MTKLEKLKAAYDAAEADFHVACYAEDAAAKAAYDDYDAAYAKAAAALDASEAAWAGYQEELKKQEENSDD
jgi:hypothetical protein